MKVLIAHHLETCWDGGLRMYGKRFDVEANKLREHLEENEYDRVILTRFEGGELEDAHYDAGLHRHIDEVHEYAYGWEADQLVPYGEEGVDWTEGGQHSEVVMLTDWMHELRQRNAKVDLCGAFDGQCVEDMEIALDAVGVPVNRLEHLIT